MSGDFTLFHNPRCGKSRAALALLEQHGIQPQIIEYLKTPPDAAELRTLIARLGIRPEELIRKGEEVYRQHYAGKTLTDSQWIAAMAKHPILIERPIVVSGKRAVIGRPTDRVKDLLK
jgi:arsenate reductase